VGDLQWARASYNSIRGRISSHWTQTANSFLLKVSIPANTTATVFIPAKPGALTTEGGKPASASKGVNFLRHDNGRAVFAVGSGDYEFSVAD
jgi:alpha-L-rhamnosidase